MVFGLFRFFFTGPAFSIPHTTNNQGYILWSIAGPSAEIFISTGSVIRIKDFGWQVVARNRSLNDSA